MSHKLRPVVDPVTVTQIFNSCSSVVFAVTDLASQHGQMFNICLLFVCFSYGFKIKFKVKETK